MCRRMESEPIQDSAPKATAPRVFSWDLLMNLVNIRTAGTQTKRTRNSGQELSRGGRGKSVIRKGGRPHRTAYKEAGTVFIDTAATTEKGNRVLYCLVMCPPRT